MRAAYPYAQYAKRKEKKRNESIKKIFELEKLFPALQIGAS